MVSAFISREFGYGFSLLSSGYLQKVNSFSEGQDYTCENAAMSKYGNMKKQKLTEQIFVKWLEYGASKEGYWNYDSMAIQIENCIDVLQVLFPQFDIVFLLDYSNGHDKIRPDCLNPTRMQKLFLW